MAYYSLLLLFIFEYMRPGSYVPVLGHANAILALVTLALALSQPGVISNGAVLQERNAKWIMYFLLLIGLSLFFTAEVTFVSYQRLSQVFGHFLFFYMIVKLTSDLRRLKQLFVTLTLIHIGLVILNPDLIFKPEVRSYIQGVTFLGDGNDFALSVCIVVPMCLFLIQEAKAMWQKLIYIAAMGMLFMSIIGTSSRGAAIAITCVLFYMWFNSRKKMLGVVGLVIVALGVIVFAPTTYYERMETVADYETEGSAQGRLQAWAAAIRMAKDHPLTGVGAGHFGMKYANAYRPPDYEGDTMRWLTAHSVYFLTLGEFGIPGVIFLFAMIVGSLRINRRGLKEIDRLPVERRETYRRLLLALSSSMIAFAVGGAFLSAIYYPHIYVIAALLTVSGIFYRQELENAVRAESVGTDKAALAIPNPE